MSKSKESKGLMLALLITTAVCLRAPITSVGAILYCIVEDLNLSNTLAGSIGTIPLIVMAVFSPVVTKVSESRGMCKGMFYGMALMIVGILLRSFGGVSGLLVGTIIIAMGITFGNVLVPVIIKIFFPNNVGSMTGLYTTIMSAFSGIAAGVSVPIAVGLGLGWRWMFCIWAAASFVCLCVIAACIKKNPEEQLMLAQNAAQSSSYAQDEESENYQLAQNGQNAEMETKTAKKPMYKSVMAWALAIMFAGQSLVFFTLTAWLPTIITDRGFSAEEAGMIAMIFMVAGIPANFGVPIIASKFKHMGRLAAVIAGVGTLGLVILLFANNMVMFVLAAVLIQLGIGGVFSLNLALYGLKTSDGAKATEVSAFAQSVGYILAAIGPFAAGVLYDATLNWSTTILLCIGCMVFDTIASYIAGEGEVM